MDNAGAVLAVILLLLVAIFAALLIGAFMLLVKAGTTLLELMAANPELVWQVTLLLALITGIVVVFVGRSALKRIAPATRAFAMPYEVLGDVFLLVLIVTITVHSADSWLGDTLNYRLTPRGYLWRDVSQFIAIAMAGLVALPIPVNVIAGWLGKQR